MRDFDATAYFNRVAAESSVGQLDSTAWNSMSDRIVAKQEQLAQASTAKVAAFKALDQRTQLRNQIKATLGGKLLSTALGNSDIAFGIVAGMQKGIAASIGFAGDVQEHGTNALAAGLRAAGANVSAQPRNPIAQDLQAMEDLLRRGGDQFTAMQSESGGARQAQSTPTGRILDPTTWSLGSDPSLKGYALHMAELVGQLVPQLATAYTKAPQAAGALMGASQAGGSQAYEAEQRLNAMDDAELAQSSTFYRELIADGVRPEQARHQVTRAASGAAAGPGALVGGLGGALSGYILGPMHKVLKGSALQRIGIVTGTEALSEGVEETTESITARTATNLAIGGNQDVQEGTFGDFALGALAGGAIAGVPAVLSEVTDNKARGKAALDELTKRSDLFNTVAESGNPEAFLDSKLPTYNPPMAMNALMVYHTREEATPEEKQSSLAKIEGIVTTLTTQATGYRAQYEGATPEGQAADATELAGYKAERAQIGDDPAQTNRASNLDSVITDMEASMAEKAAVLPAELASRKVAMETADGLVQKAQTQFASFNAAMNVKAATLDIGNSLDVLDQTPDPADTTAVESSSKAATHILTLAMNTPQVLNEKHLTRLANSTSTAFTAPQQTLLRQLLDARVAENQLKSQSTVSQDILTGNKAQRYRGVIDVQRDFDAAMQTADQGSSAKSVLVTFQRFAADRVSKYEAAQAAFSTVDTLPNKTKFIGRQGPGTWQAVAPMSEAEREKTGSLKITPGSRAVIDLMEMEQTIVSTRAAAMQTSYDLKFAPPPTDTTTTTTPSPNQTVAPGVTVTSPPSVTGVTEVTPGVTSGVTEGTPGTSSVPALTTATTPTTATTAETSASVTPTTVAASAAVIETPVLGVTRIISGGQTGADMGGLLAGRELGIETGGTAPRGFRTDAGSNPGLAAFGVTEDTSDSYVPRTKQNVDAADVTIAFRLKPSTGTDKTIGYAQTGRWTYGTNATTLSGHRPVIVVTTRDPAAAVAQIREQLAQVPNAQTINIAGHREKSVSDLPFQAFVQKVLVEALRAPPVTPKVAPAVAVAGQVAGQVTAPGTTTVSPAAATGEAATVTPSVAPTAAALAVENTQETSAAPAPVLGTNNVSTDVRIDKAPLAPAAGVTTATTTPAPSTVTESSPAATAAVAQTPETQSTNFKESTSDNPLIREARDGVRNALLKMNFKFVDAKDAPDVTDIERIASKILSGTHNDDPVFLRDAAQALSYALFHELGATERSAATRQWIEDALFDWLSEGKAPTQDTQGVWLKVLALYNRLVGFFGSAEYTSISAKLEKAITSIRTGQADFSYKPKAGFKRLVFQDEMAANPQAVSVLTHLTQLGIPFVLTGSVAYADQVPVYRQEGKPLHDVDLLMERDVIERALQALQEGSFGTGAVLYDFPKNDPTKRVVGLAVVPVGYEVRNKKSGWRPKTNAVHRSYEVFDTATGEQVGSYSYEQNSHETFEGIAGITVDLMSAQPPRNTLDQAFPADGQQHTVKVASYVDGFTAKLGMLRYKDINDFLAVVPPDVSRPAVVESASPISAEQPSVVAPTVDNVRNDVPTALQGMGLETVNDPERQDEFTQGLWTEPDGTLGIEHRQEDGQDSWWLVEDTGPSYAATEFSTAKAAAAALLARRIELQDLTRESAVSAEEPEATTGGLKALERQEGDTNLRYQDQNLVSRFMKQVGFRPEHTSLRPLVVVKDFLTQLRTRAVDIRDFFAPRENETEDQEAAQRKVLNTFSHFVKQWDETLKKTLIRRAGKKPGSKRDQLEFRYKNPVQFFLDESGQTEENFRTAIHYALFNWIPEQVTNPKDSDSYINAQLGREKDTAVTDLERRYLANVGIRRNLLANSLGQGAVQALGLKATTDAPDNEFSRLQSALGDLVIELGLRTKVLQLTTVPQEVMLELLGTENGSTYSDSTKHFFVNISHTNQEITRQVEEITSATARSGSLLSRVFSVESGLKLPTFEPVAFSMKKVPNSPQQNVPTQLAERLDIKNHEPNILRRDMAQIWDKLSDIVLQQFMGIVDLTAVPHHISRRESQKARNDSLLRQAMNLQDWREALRDTRKGPEDDGLDTPFYIQHTVGSQQRVTPASIINRQGSKIHRHTFAIQGTEATISLTDPTALANFMLRVGEGLSIKTDKQSNRTSLAKIADLLAFDATGRVTNPLFIDAIEGLRAAIYDNTDLSGRADNALGDLALKYRGSDAKAGFHALDALVALAHYSQAQQTNATSFSTYLMGEIDGVANGPAITLLLMGISDPATMARSGFFRAEDNVGSFPEWRENSANTDLYEHSAGTLRAAITELSKAKYHIKRIMPAVLVLTGELAAAGRDLVKVPLRSMMFGSGIASAVSDMGDDFVENYYRQVETLVGLEQQPDTVANTRALIRTMNTLIDFGLYKKASPSHHIALNLTPAELMELPLSLTQINGLKTTHSKTLGSAITTTLNTDFALFLERRQTFNQMTHLVSRVYMTAYNSLRDQMIEELIAKGEIATEANEAIHTLTTKQDNALKQRIRKLLPMVATSMSQANDELGSGVFIPKFELEMDKTAPYQVESTFSDPTGRKEMLTSSVAALRKVMADPGVRALILLTHSTDSAIASGAYAKLKVLNLHDALGIGLNDMIKAGQALNEGTWNILLNYSPSFAMLDTLKRSLTGLSELLDAGAALDPRDVRAMLEPLWDRMVFAEDEVPPGFTDLVQKFAGQALNAERAKLTQMKDTTVVSQYALEGGAYEVTPAQRADATERLTELQGTETLLSPAFLATLNKLDTFLGTLPDVAPTDEIEDDSFFDFEADLSNTEFSIVERISQNQSLVAEVREAAAVIRKTMVAEALAFDRAWKVIDPGVVSADLAAQVKQQFSAHRLAADTRLGPLGVSQIPSDGQWVKFFEGFNGKPIPIRAVLKELRQRTQTAPKGRQAEFQATLVNALIRLVDPAGTVIYATEQTNLEELVLKDVSESRGFLTVQGGMEHLIIKSPAFLHSGLTTELLAHEVTHAALSGIIAAAEADPTHPAHLLVKDLETLRLAAAELVNSDATLVTQYANAIDNVQELVAWGMTNPGFQRDVMNKVTVKGGLSPAAVAPETGMKRFIRLLTGILFRGSGKTQLELAENGMSMLIAATSQLMGQAAKAKSSKASQDRTLAMAATVTPLDTLGLFNAIGTQSQAVLTPRYTQHLEGLLAGIVNKIRTPYAVFHAEHAADPTQDPVSRFLHTLVTGNRPFISRAMGANFAIAPQSAFVLEQVEAVIEFAARNAATMTETSALYKDMQRVWREAATRLSAADFHKAFSTTDWLTATPHERLVAQEQYDFVFTQIDPQLDGTTHIISRFAALVLTVPQIEAMVTFPTFRNETQWKDLKWFDRIVRAFTKILEVIFGRTLPGFEGQPAALKIRDLVDALVDIEQRRRDLLNSKESSFAARLDRATNALSVRAKGAVVRTGQSAMFQKSSSKLIKFSGTALSLVASDRVGDLATLAQKMRDRVFQERAGVVNTLVTEVMGAPARVHAALLGTKRNEQLRKHAKDTTVASVIEAFVDKGKNLTPTIRAALTKVLLRTDLHTLLVHNVSLRDIEELLRSPAALEQRITAMEQQLTTPTTRKLYLRQAKDLGAFLATGVNKNPLLARNAYVMARAKGHGLQTKITEAQARAVEPILEQLSTLYALTHLRTTDRQMVSEVMKAERLRPPESNEAQANGVEFTLKLHTMLQQQSKERLFDGSEALMTKAYLPELYNGSLEVTTADAIEGQKLLNHGWVLVGPVIADPDAPAGNPRMLYKLVDRGQRRLVSGALSMTGMRQRGTRLHTGLTSAFDGLVHQANTRTHRDVLAKKAAGIAVLASTPESYSPDVTQGPEYSAPVYNAAGEVVNFAELMRDSVKDTVLERDNDFSQLLGSLQGNILDKVSSVEQNRKVVQVLHDQHRAEVAKHPGGFLEVSATAPTKDMQEMWFLLPESAKQAAYDVTGDFKLYVRTDLVNHFFGYRKASMGAALTKAVDAVADRKHDRDLALPGMAKPKSGMDSVMEAMFLSWGGGMKVGLRVGQAEDIWQELVQVTKDVMVVKSGTALAYNVASNNTQLFVAGVSIGDIRRHAQVALPNVLEHVAASRKLQELKNQRDSGYLLGSIDALTVDIALLEDSLQKNPVHGLIDAGLLPTIVEDVSLNDDEDSHVSRLQQRLKPYTDHIPAWIRTTGRVAFIMHDTPLYRVMSQGTQISDFVSRYTLYQHLISRKINPLTHNEAVLRASEDFVNYDLPSGAEMQYLNDMGVLFFTKYYLRMQRTIHRLFAENPARALMLIGVDQYFGTMQTVVDSIVHVGNPLHAGALELFNVWDENMLFKLFSPWKG